ncbi:MAG: diguanylate cyclase [Castellaniella sp.]|uniref:diguanylate cyclase domain-containing protein n=1 Tax=Castellaniella sp. TaxID=1955812 RepID=UPI00121848C1|nr:diguanylate cyclase [Castellaniella sp.]TAN28212.1 MAG: diguanylate cyclase [Castellaniella sp.]
MKRTQFQTTAERTASRTAPRHLNGLLVNGLILAIFGLVIMALWLALHHRIASERSQAITAAMRANANIAIAYEQDISRTLKAAEQVMSFARTQYLQQGPTLDLRRWAQRRVIRDQAFTIISIVDELGNIVDSSQNTGPVNYADRDFFQAQRNDMRDALYINRPVLGRVSGQWRIPMSLRITRPDGSFGGVVVLSVDPDTLTDFYREIDLGHDGMLELAALNGMVLGRQISGQNVFGIDAGGQPWFQRQKLNPEDDFVDDGASTDGIPRIISYRSVRGYPVMVSVGMALHEILAPVNQQGKGYRNMTVYASIALLAFAAFIMLLLARQRAVSRALAASEARLTHAVLHDPLTGLSNRVLFQERCDRALQVAQRHDQRVAVLYLDLDGFKAINDQFGHATGDTLLQQVARRLETRVRAGSDDTVSRFGGDEFCILLTAMKTPKECEAIAQNVLRALSTPFELDGIPVEISVSIGVALSPEHGRDTATLIKQADAAMYTAKRTGRNRFVWGGAQA